MRKVKLSAIQSKIGTILILFTVIFTSSVTYANPIAVNPNGIYPNPPVNNVYNFIFQVIGFGIVILILGLISLLLIMIIRKIIFEASEIKNELQVKNTIHKSAVTIKTSQEKDERGL